MKASPINQPWPGVPRRATEDLVLGREGDVVEISEGLLDVPGDDDDAQREHVEVHGEGEELPGLTDAAQVAVEEHQDRRRR